MSPEHSFLESSQSVAREATFLGGGDQIDLHASSLEPIEVIRARQAIATAIASTASSNLEVHAAPVVAEKIAPQKLIANFAARTIAMRKDLNADTISTSDFDLVV